MRRIGGWGGDRNNPNKVKRVHANWCNRKRKVYYNEWNSIRNRLNSIRARLLGGNRGMNRS